MEFDWRRAIDRCGENLCDIAARLVVMAGIQAGRTVETLPRHLYRAILAMLRPAEFAARRLILMAACKLEWTIAAPKPPLLPRLVRGTGAPASPLPAKPTPELPLPAFLLFDPFKPAGSPWLEPGDEDGADWLIEDAGPDPDEPVDARALCRRVRALADALADLDAQALRLARWRARRSAETAALAAGRQPAYRTRPSRWSPLRPGLPPGWRRRPRTALEEVVKECELLGRDAWNTS